MNHSVDADLIIVGCGVAGLSAAVTALESGLSVINLERAGQEDFGGNSRWTEAYMRMKNDSEVADDFEEHFAFNAGWNLDLNVLAALGENAVHQPSYVRAHSLPDPEVIARFADAVPSTLDWLKGFGLKFAPQPIYLLTQNTARIAAQGGGLAIIETLRDKALALGGEIRYRTTAVDLLRGEDGAVTGVVCTSPDGLRRPIRARNVLLASGGFQGNPEMMTQYIGVRSKYIRPVATGGYYNKGEGIRMALAAGAAPAGEFGSFHAEPVDPRSRQAEAVVFIYPYGMLVNNRGQRFTDEAPGTVDAHYDNITRSIADQPDGICYVIFDSRVEDVPRWKTSIRSDQPAFSAPTIEALAEQLGLPPEALGDTVNRFNAACPRSDNPAAAFDPFTLDHRATHGLAVEKSHWSRPIDKPPYLAYPIIATNCFTFGGLKVNRDAQVLDQDGRVLRGLYAAGETVGIYHQVYTGSTSVLRGLVFGRLAAQHAAAHAASELTP